jgi:hypothetical protein
MDDPDHAAHAETVSRIRHLKQKINSVAALIAAYRASKPTSSLKQKNRLKSDRRQNKPGMKPPLKRQLIEQFVNKMALAREGIELASEQVAAANDSVREKKINSMLKDKLSNRLSNRDEEEKYIARRKMLCATKESLQHQLRFVKEATSLHVAHLDRRFPIINLFLILL